MAVRDDGEREPLTKNLTDEPPSYENSTAHGQPSGEHPIDDKLKWDRSTGDGRKGAGVSSTSGPLPPRPRASSFSPSSGTSNQVQQTICTLIRDLVLNADSPDLLDSCVNACQTYCLNLSTLLQEPFIERRTPIYWAIVKSGGALLPSLLVHAAPLSECTVSEIRLACLVTGNQNLFQSLRCKRGSLRKELTPLSMSCHADTLVLGSMPADAISIHDIDGQGPFAVDMRINLWQKRMRVVGVVSVEFIARGRVWSLRFATPPSSTVVGMWHIELTLLEHSPPTFIDSTLFIDMPPESSNLSESSANTSQRSELISLSPPPEGPSSPRGRSPTLSQPSKSNTVWFIKFRLGSMYRVAYRDSKILKQWKGNDGNTCTNAIVVPLNEGAGTELMYDNTPFLDTEGTLYARFEARLEKPR